MSLKMKSSFNSLDIAISVNELKSVLGFRIDQIFDIDEKTYLLKLRKGDDKRLLLIESGIRFHFTNYDWQKNPFPSNFTMKLRKHLRNRRIEKVKRLGRDRIVDFEIGSGLVAHHLIIELFNRGNIILTDSELRILRVLRPHTEGDRFKFAVREEYPISRVQYHTELPDLKTVFEKAKSGEKLIKILLPHVEFGPALLEHILLLYGFNKDKKYTGQISPEELEQINTVLQDGKALMEDITSKVNPGYVIKHVEEIEGQEKLITYYDVQPYLFQQYTNTEFEEYKTFSAAVDEYFSKLENNRNQYKLIQKQREAVDKVEKVKADQDKRLESLILKQSEKVIKAEIILANAEIIDQVINIIRQAIAAQIQWSAIDSCLSGQKDIIGLSVDKLMLEINHITVSLNDPFSETPKKVSVDLDLALSAHANATRYYSESKLAAVKERKTMEAQEKALKSVRQKAKNILKDVEKTFDITVTRKPFWFEKFYWFISSDKFLVIGGRDQQQNEMMVKRYLKKGDIYVHADLHGASTVIIKNPSGNVVPPRTLEESGCMAVCYSVGWEAKVISSAWWVNYDQVSKTAPTGEYLNTGSFMIRGNKNYLFPAQLCLGFGFLFRLEDECALKYLDDKKPKWVNTDLDETESQESSKLNYEPDTVKTSKDSVKSLSCDEGTNVVKTDMSMSDDSNSDVASSFLFTHDENLLKFTSYDKPKDVIDFESNQGETSTAVTKFETNKDITNIQRCIEEIIQQTNIKREGSKRISKKERKQMRKLKKVKLDNDVEDGKVEEKSEGKDIEEETEDASSEFTIKDNSEYYDLEAITKKQFNELQELIEEDVRSTETLVVKSWDADVGSKESAKVVKRGQKSKQKKIKEKYKDQDDEERSLRMSILKPDGEKKLSKKELKDLKRHKKLKVSGKKIVKESITGKNIEKTNLGNLISAELSTQKRSEPNTTDQLSKKAHFTEKNLINLIENLPTETSTLIRITKDDVISKSIKESNFEKHEPVEVKISSELLKDKSVVTQNIDDTKYIESNVTLETGVVTQNIDDTKYIESNVTLETGVVTQNIDDTKYIESNVRLETGVVTQNIDDTKYIESNVTLETGVVTQNIDDTKYIESNVTLETGVVTQNIDDTKYIESNETLETGVVTQNIDDTKYIECNETLETGAKDEEQSILESLDIILKLSSNPAPDDELLFSLPIIAPYSALSNFRHKIKLLPGNQTRGKAAKAALNQFLINKEYSEKEKLLMKKIQIESIARNLPGKVKLHITKSQKK